MRKWLLTGIALAVMGCVQTNATILNPSAQAYPAVHQDSVRIFVSEDDLEGYEFERIAIVNAKGSGTYTNEDNMLNAMRKKAGKLGANAIIMPKIDEPGSGAKVAAAIFGTDTQRKGEVIAIRVHNPNWE